MPKIKKGKSALSKTRELLKLTELDSDLETDSSSDCSEGYSHVPLDSEIPLLNSLSIEEKTNAMEQISADIARLAQMLHDLNDKQNQQQTALNALFQNGANTSNDNSGHSAPAQNVAAGNLENFFRIPDPIKSLPSFDGNRKQLSYWLTTAENTLNFFKDRVSDEIFKMYQTAVINKIDGRAKDIICLAGNPQDFDSVKSILTTALGDRQELSTYKCQLWRNKMSDGISIHKYYQKCKEILQNIKTIAKQNQNYRDNWAVINSFIEEDGLAAFIAGLQQNYFGHVQAARPKDIEDAYAFLCKFRSQEITAERTKPNHQEPNKEKTSYKQNHQHNHPPNKTYHRESDKPKPETTTAESMDIGSTKSKLTLNRRLVHNNEVCEANPPENLSDSESDSEVEANFHVAQMTNDQT